MNETQRLEMLVKHYEDKEKKLIEYIEKEINACGEAKNMTDNHSIQMNWTFYQNALKKVLKRIEILERVDND